MKHSYYKRGGGEGNTRKLLVVMDVFITLIVVTASQVYAYVQTHQIVYIKHMQGFFVVVDFVYQLHLNKVIKKLWW